MAGQNGSGNGGMMRRQRYRLRVPVAAAARPVCPDWVHEDGVYEGDIDPSSQDFHELRIRLFCPDDPDLSFLVVEDVLEEVD